MEYETLIGTRKRRASFLTLLIATFFVILMLYGHYHRHLVEKTWLIYSCIFFDLFFFLGFVWALLEFLDNRPLIIISKDGIVMRKRWTPFSKSRHFPWSEIEYYLTQIHVIKGFINFFLIIGVKSSNKEYRTELSSLNISESDVLRSMKYYSTKYGFRDSGRINTT